ncbi:MAG: Pr6Pr family membrane protein [Bacteroidales bacterium]|jgi:hypothetical protein|nr:Pr6Pr family membrane protein [Bacteroidales bacterium]
MKPSPREKSSMIFRSALGAMAWIAVILDFILSDELIWNFISYFTIISNTLIAVAMTMTVTVPGSRFGAFFSRSGIQSALALYIIIVGLVYNFNLRNTWAITGFLSIVDYLLHVVIPLAYIVYWLIFIPKRALNWTHSIIWLIFPLVYLGYSLARGAITGWYPYPFLDVAKLGYEKVLLNSAFVTSGFLLFAVLLIFINRSVKLLPKRTRST